MVTRSARDVFGYGVRLFGYLLVTVVLGGALIAGGVGVVETLEPGVVLGDASPDGYAPVAAGGALVLLGVLVLVAGVFATAFAGLADAVAVGLETAFTPAEGNERPTERDAVSTDADGERSERTGDATGTSVDGDADTGNDGRPTSDPLAGGTGPDGDQPGGGSGVDGSPAERGDDPLGGPAGTGDALTGGSDGGDPLAGSDGSEEAWRREIESKLDDDESAGE
ncbi:hypothetical protein [Halapricum desulfuricans]|uniref:Uncharacterized protein n=1 Tax=Halapricum desulfuricans TaxID=2841257 RepID=A0A897N351_9EURY|nr:hypothetical protein [Halapricum desulfuricans]QSG06911.1 hypothetical protein HSR121_2591 [Halapricum desulfuricans]